MHPADKLQTRYISLQGRAQNRSGVQPARIFISQNTYPLYLLIAGFPNSFYIILNQHNRETISIPKRFGYRCLNPDTLDKQD